MQFHLSACLLFLLCLRVSAQTRADITKLVYFNITQGAQTGQIVFGLYGKLCPITIENFRALCTGEKGGILTYKNSKFHRVMPNFMDQGGDITKGDGTGGMSIYGPSFADENLTLKFTKPGQLAMANSGKNTNNSQFFITTIMTDWLNGLHVIFGEVVKGYPLALQINTAPTDAASLPKTPVVISGAGEMPISMLASFPIEAGMAPVVGPVTTAGTPPSAAASKTQNGSGRIHSLWAGIGFLTVFILAL